MRIVLLGAPGSGKGTQANKLQQLYGFPKISTGDALRSAVEEGTSLGRMAKASMDAGQLVADEVVLGIIRNRLNQKDVEKGFVLDGFPRNLAQAEALDAALEEQGQPLELVILIDVDFDLLLQRMVGRYTCRSCGWTCNIFTAPPRVDGICDRCGGNLHHRADDNEETISNRLRIFETQTQPLIAYYQDKGILRRVQGVGDIDDVFAAIRKVIDQAAAGRQPARRQRPTTKSVAAAIVAQRARKQKTEPAEARAGKKTVTTTKKTSPGKKVAGKKTAAKKTVAKKTAVKKTAVKKTAVKKSATKKTAAKKSAAKKSAAKKSAVRKSPAAVKKKAAKKTAPKKTAVRKAPVKKKVTKKAVPKKVTKKKAVARKTAKKTGVKKALLKKTPVKKATTKKTAKPTAKKKTVKKTAAKRR